MPRTPVVVVCVLLLGSAGLAHAEDAEVQAIVKAGLEGDTNPRRLNGSGSDADLAERLFLELSLADSAPDQVLSASLLIGGKRYHRTSAESSLVVDASGGWQRRISGGLGVYFRVLARDRLEEGHARDYARVAGRLGLTLNVDTWSFAAGPVLEYFLYRPDADLSYLSLGAGGQIGWTPSEAVGVVASYSYAGRGFREERILSDDVVGLRLGDDPRSDEGHVAGLGASLDLGFVANLDLYWQRNVSNSFGKSFTRMFARGSGTFSLPARLFLTLQATVQRTIFDDEVLIDPTFSIEEEDRNSAVVAVSGDILDWLGWEVRYNLFLQAFGGDDSDYERHLVYGGLIASTPE